MTGARGRDEMAGRAGNDGRSRVEDDEDERRG